MATQIRYRIKHPSGNDLVNIKQGDTFEYRSIQYPANWVEHATPGEMAAIGMERYEHYIPADHLERQEFFDRLAETLISTGKLTLENIVSVPVDIWLESKIRSHPSLDARLKMVAINRVRSAQRFYRRDEKYPDLLDTLGALILNLTPAQIDAIYD